jgi:3-isopropylmalate/(R)-2-methylmalate dehydratase small subunit
MEEIIHSVLKGKVVWKFGDHFCTDMIVQYPLYKHIKDKEGLAKICMVRFDPEFSKKVEKGDFVVAGRNFVYGHAHMQAFQALKATGIGSIIAESFSRGWSSVVDLFSMHLPAFWCDGISKKVKVSDQIEVVVETGEIKNLTTGEVLKMKPFPQLLLGVIEAGGVVPYLKKSQKQTE